MRFRVRDILLVSSLYDSYIFEEDGRLYELIRQEYHGLNLSHSPELIQVSSGEDAIELASEENRFNLIICTQHIEDMHSIEFAKRAKATGLNIPIVLLGYDNREMNELLEHPELNIFEQVFIWQGDYRIILGIIKSLEDKYNVDYDTKNVGVQAIILVEDNIRFYSSYLPLIYTEVLIQAQSLISEGINLSHKFLRMRARPKILLCSTYEQAMDYYNEYEEYVLGVISDIEYTVKGVKDKRAGIKFAQTIRKQHPDIPVLLQSNNDEFEDEAEKIGASFLLKDSPVLLQQLRKFMKEYFSFGDFVFRNNEGAEVDRAKNLLEFENKLKTVPDESIVYHASGNHFSNWLKARTEFWLAHQLRPKKVEDFKTVNDLRKLLIDFVSDFRKSRQRGQILDFNRSTFESANTFARIGGGSLGGKARGLGFVNSLLSNFEIRNKFDGVEIFVPTAVVLGTEVFDEFMEMNNLWDFALRCRDDEILINTFLKAKEFPPDALDSLFEFLEITKVPIAVRSSSLLEDSQGQPFAGVYDTFMLPNNNTDIRTRMLQLLNSIKKIYACIYFQKSKDYIKVTSYRLEEEKMAVIIQKVVGEVHGGKYYPEVSGVAKSYNFYPAPPLKSNDGIVSVAFGLGKTIAEGGESVRFCPKYPHHLLQFATIEDTLNFSPQEFFALDMNAAGEVLILEDDKLVTKHHITEAEDDGTLYQVASTYSSENDAIYDGISRAGVRLFTLAPILKYHVFPLPEILELLLEMGSWGMSSPVEIEFAVNLSVKPNEPKEFAILQMRPLVLSSEIEELNIDEYKDRELICKSNQVLGNGVVEDIYDIIFIDKEKFDRSKSKDVATEVAQFNSTLIHENKRYLLIGVGRWGTLDPWLGIPVTWEQISGAKAIVEANFKDFNVTPSQGSHFFQNITSFKVGYFTVNSQLGKGFVDWSWLNSLKTNEIKKYTKHIILDDPITIKINGQENRGIIVKPNVKVN